MLAGVRIVVAMTHFTTAGFYAGQLAALRRAGAEVALLASPSPVIERQCEVEGARYVPIAMERAPSAGRDARAFSQIVRALTRLRPDIVNAGTPKAGLLVTVAAAGLRVPVRVHTLHGLRYEVSTGIRRGIYWSAQRASCMCATSVICVSRSLRDRAVETGLLQRGQGVVLGDGTVNGVDTDAFARDEGTISAGRALRARLGITSDQPVVGYLGRLCRDKGIADLLMAWKLLGDGHRRLVLAGDLDETDPLSPRELATIREAPDVSHLGYVPDPSAFLAAVDLLVLPTWREGFPSAPLEAAAMEVPTVATRVTGCVDAVVDGVTGALVEPGDAAGLASAIGIYLADSQLRRAHGKAARERVVQHFTRQRLQRLTIDFYARELARGRG